MSDHLLPSVVAFLRRGRVLEVFASPGERPRMLNAMESALLRHRLRRLRMWIVLATLAEVALVSTALKTWPGGTAARGRLHAPIVVLRDAAPTRPDSDVESAKDISLGQEAAGSSLAAQNDLFALGTAARSEGNLERAIELYTHLIEAWPHGPLSESATVERLRLQVRQGGIDSAGAARTYLERYPNGFARNEAQSVIDGLNE
jgi:hypothetical protein